MQRTEWLDLLEAVGSGRGALAMAAQPIADLSTGAVAGFEMLARFPDRPREPPAEWFTAAARLGRGPDLQAAALAAALGHRQALPPNTFLSVNIDPWALGSPQVQAVLTAAGDLTRVVVELTEHVPFADVDRLRPGVDRVRDLGGLVAVDDAGAGYAGLNALIALRPGLVKVDRALVAGCDSDPGKRAAVALLGELASQLDAWLLAEGVETLPELDALVAMGVPLGQGWLFARPGEPWPSICPGAAAAIRDAALRRSRPHSLAGLVSRVDLLPPRGPLRPGVVVDADGRPSAVVVPAPDGRLVRLPAMTVAVSSAPSDVALRAMARPQPHRFAPVVCTDGAGGALGVVTVEALMEWLVRRSGGSAAGPPDEPEPDQPDQPDEMEEARREALPLR